MQPHVRIWSRKATAVAFLALFGLATAPGCEEDAWYCTGGTTCFGRQEENCLSVAGCNMDGDCGDRLCIERSAADCERGGCFWTGLACGGRNPECAAHLDGTACNADPRCIWTPGCGGTPTIRCGSLYEQDTCEAVSYCRWERSTSAIGLF